MIRLAIVAGATFRRVLGVRSVLLAVGLGAAAGLLVNGVPSPEIAREAYGALVVVLGGLLVLPIAAAVPTEDRAGGMEALVALRPVRSVGWAMGRMFGALSGLGLLVVLLASSAMLVAARAEVPAEVTGVRVDGGPPAAPEWRFGIPAGSQGPFELHLSVLMLAPMGDLELTVRRAREKQVIDVPLRAQRSARIPVPDLSPARGDLFVTVRAGEQMHVTSRSAQLVIGTQPLGREGLRLPRGGALAIVMGVIAVVAFATAFRFETACLAGLLGLMVPREGFEWWATGVLALVVATLGTALSRRQAMP